jgi:hypothetical protein
MFRPEHLPMPARYAEVNPDYTQRPEPEAMLDAIRG